MMERWDDGEHRVEMAAGISFLAMWKDAEPLLDKATERSHQYTSGQSLFREIYAQEKQLWVVYRCGETPTQDVAVAVGVTALHDYAKCKVCRIVTCSGEGVEKWADMGIDAIERWAKANGVERMIPSGRPGWRKVFERRGYKMTHVTMEKAL